MGKGGWGREWGGEENRVGRFFGGKVNVDRGGVGSRFWCFRLLFRFGERDAEVEVIIDCVYVYGIDYHRFRSGLVIRFSFRFFSCSDVVIALYVSVNLFFSACLHSIVFWMSSWVYLLLVTFDYVCVYCLHFLSSAFSLSAASTLMIFRGACMSDPEVVFVYGGSEGYTVRVCVSVVTSLVHFLRS